MIPVGTLLVGALASTFARRVVVLEPRIRKPYRRSEWLDAIVLVDSGIIQLEMIGQPRRCFRRGDVMWLGGLGLSAIYNPGPEVAILIAVWRRAQPRSIGDSREP